MTNWHQLVEDHAKRTGQADMPSATVAELAAHLEDLYAAARADGTSDADARQLALDALAEAPLADLARRARRRPDSRPGATAPEPASSLWTGLVGEFRHALRQMKRAPSFAAIAVVTLGLGAGAATAIFSIVDAVLLRPLPFHEPDRLVTIWDANPERSLPRERISPVNFMDYRTIAAFDDAAAWWRPEVNLAEPDKDPVRVDTIETSANLFHMLGVSPQLGSGFPIEDTLHNRERMAIISDRFWRQQYDADPAIVGKTINAMDGPPYTIVGVMPPGFHFPDEVDLWLRLQWDLTRHSRAAHFMEGVARLKRGVDADAAARELSALTSRLATDYAATNAGWTAHLTPLLDDMLGYYRPALIVLMGAVAVLLLTACINVASLLLARAGARGREMAIRAALGASRGRLVRQMLVESLLLAAGGTLAGAIGAMAILNIALASMPVAIPRMANAGLDVRLLAFAALVTAGTAILFGLVPALIVSRTRAAEALKESGRSSTSARSRVWNRALVVAEVALASMALVASALLVQSVARMMESPIGIVPDGVVTTDLQMEVRAGVEGWNVIEQQYANLLESLRRQPGVESAGLTNALPLTIGWRLAFGIVGRIAPSHDEQVQAMFVSAGDGYFETMGARLVAGRLFDARDRHDTEPVMIINETMARRFFGDSDPIGQQINSLARQVGPLGRNLAGPVPHRVIGIIADIQQAPIGQAAEPVVYHTTRQFPFAAMAIAMRGPDASRLADAVRAAVKETNPTLALGDIETMEARLKDAAAEPRLLMFVLTAFAILTGLLAALGVYGLLAWVVNERRRELAIRLALGAKPAGLARLVTGQGLVLSIAGVAIGLVAAQALGGVLDDVLFQTRTSDPGAAFTAGALLVTAALAACAAPAIRAARVEPSEGLRD